MESNAQLPREEIIELFEYDVHLISVSQVPRYEYHAVFMDTETGALYTEIYQTGGGLSIKTDISYERMYRLADDYDVENKDVFKQLTKENRREWCNLHREVTVFSRPKYR